MTNLVRNEIEVPGAHLGTFESKRQGLAGAFKLSRAIVDLLLERFVQIAQSHSGPLLIEQEAARLVLAAPAAKRGTHSACQSLGVDGPLQQYDVAKTLQQARGPRRARPCLLRRQYDDGQIRPGRLRLAPLEDWLQPLPDEGFFSHENRARFGVQLRAQIAQLLADMASAVAAGEHVLHHFGIATARGQDEDAFLRL